MRLRDAPIAVKMVDDGEFMASAYGDLQSWTAHVHVDISGKTTAASFSWTEIDEEERGRETIDVSAFRGHALRTSVMARWAKLADWFHDAPTAAEVDDLLSRMEDEARSVAKRWLDATRRADA